MTIGVVSALPVEMNCLVTGLVELNTPFRINKNIIGIVCGTGANNAAKAAGMLMYQDIKGLVSWGTAGALIDELKSGDLLMPDTILSATGKSYDTHRKWAGQLKEALGLTSYTVHSGILAESGYILDSPEAKSGFKTRTGAVAVDMETAAIMKIAQSNGLPSIAIRSVVDQASDSLPGEILRHIDLYGNPAIMRIATEVIRKPGLLTHLIRLSSAMRAASSTLRAVAAEADNTFRYSF